MKSGQRTGGKQSAPKKRKSASALADAAGLRAVKALAARRKGTAEAEEDVDDLQEAGEGQNRKKRRRKRNKGRRAGKSKSKRARKPRLKWSRTEKKGQDQRY